MMNILMPTDFSPNSRNAVSYALQFFKDTPTHFYFLHVLPVPSDQMASSYMSMSPLVRGNFEKLLNWVNSIKTNAEHHFHTCFTANHLVDAIREKVLEKNIDLILMGTKGTTNREGVMIGRNTSDVMMKVRCPVLAISENTVYRDYREILFPTDYKINYGSKMFGTLRNLRALSKAEIKILEIFSSEEEPFPDQLRNRQFLQGTLSPKTLLLQRCYIQKEINSKKLFLATRGIDMIVLAAKNLNLCQRFLHSNQNQIPFFHQLPLLVLHG